MRTVRAIAIASVVTLALCACGFGINRSFRIADGDTVESGRSTVNGNVELSGSRVEGTVTVHNSDVELHEGSVVTDDVIVEGGAGHTIEILIADGSVVEGDVIVRKGSAVVRLMNGGMVKGRVRGAEIVSE